MNDEKGFWNVAQQLVAERNAKIEQAAEELRPWVIDVVCAKFAGTMIRNVGVRPPGGFDVDLVVEALYRYGFKAT